MATWTNIIISNCAPFTAGNQERERGKNFEMERDTKKNKSERETEREREGIVYLEMRKRECVYFYVCGCCVFRPAFGCCMHPKAGRNTFFNRFQPFLFISKKFHWFHAWNQQKTSENEKINFFPFLPTPQSWSTCKSWSTPWGGTSKSSSFGWFVCEEFYEWYKKSHDSINQVVFVNLGYLDFRCEITEKGLK